MFFLDKQDQSAKYNRTKTGMLFEVYHTVLQIVTLLVIFPFEFSKFYWRI